MCIYREFLFICRFWIMYLSCVGLHVRVAVQPRRICEQRLRSSFCVKGNCNGNSCSMVSNRRHTRVIAMPKREYYNLVMR
jgi:hypothetical protein